MRSTRTVQPSVFQAPEVVHPIAAELEPASVWLDQHPELLDTISGCVAGSSICGRQRVTCETIVRCAVIKHLMRYSYRELEFALLDSATMQHFARVDPFGVPRKSALQSAISAIDADAWRSISGVLLEDAKAQGIEPGNQVRIDSTVTETDILEPADSRLLYDVVRVPARLLRQARQRVATIRITTTAAQPSGASGRSGQRGARSAGRRSIGRCRGWWHGRSRTRRRPKLKCAA